MIINKYRSGITGEEIDKFDILRIFDVVGKGGLDLLEANGYIVKSGVCQHESNKEFVERCSWQELADQHHPVFAIRKYMEQNPGVSLCEAKNVIDKYMEDARSKFKTGVKMKGWDE